jgi:hypothetical protein
MSVLMVTYDLKQPGRDYTPVHRYLKQFAYCKDLESFWLLDTTMTAEQVRDGLKAHVDSNDKVFVARLGGNWGSYNFGCAAWLNESSRRW